jgi:putative membrane protein
VPLHRVQVHHGHLAAALARPALAALRLDIAGLANPESREGRRSDRLLPVGDLPTGARWSGRCCPASTCWRSRPIRRHRGRAGCTRLALRYLGAGLSPEVFVTREGMLTRQMSLVPYARLQSVRVVQGPIQR